jgi:predicted RNase H-like HicB family nuclease
MYRTVIIIVQNQQNYEASCPDLPGCTAVGNTPEEAKQNIHDIIIMRLHDMIKNRQPIPLPHTTVEFIEIAFPKMTI